MGYAQHDVQDALARDEPSAIKDAYLIVRENQLMKTNRTLHSARHDPLLTNTCSNTEQDTLGRHVASYPCRLPKQNDSNDAGFIQHPFTSKVHRSIRT